MQTILLALEFKHSVQTLVDKTLEFAQLLNAQIHLIHVQDENNPDSKITELKEIQDVFVGHDFKCTISEKSGDVIDVILSEAADIEASYIIIGTRQHGRMHHLYFANAKEVLADLTPCPLLIVPHD